MRNDNPLNDLERQHWLRQPTKDELQTTIAQLWVWSAAGWASALSFAAAFLWMLTRG